MDELPQDLGLALEDPSLKHDSDEHGDFSGSDMKIDAYRKRKTRKRRTTDTLFQPNLSNSINLLNNSPKSSSSVDDSRNYRYLESYTANCSEETDERPRQGQISRVGIHRTVDRTHKRVFKQARPCYCESDSHTENAPVYPRKQRKKKFKRIPIDTAETVIQSESSEVKSKWRQKWKNQRNEQLNSVEGATNLKIVRPPSRDSEHCRRAKSCGHCSSKACGNLAHSHHADNASSDVSSGISMQRDDVDSNCRCACHNGLLRNDSSVSGSSYNSDTDSANFTPDDIGGDGDDEMTDFCAESDGGSVLGIPRCRYMPWLALHSGGANFKGDKVWFCGVERPKPGQSMNSCNSPVWSSSNHSPNDMTRSAVRQNKYAKSAICYNRRHRRRTKMKKNKAKNLKEQDLNQLNKLSLANRNKRMRLDGVKNSNLPTHRHGVPFVTITHRDDEEMKTEESSCKRND